MGAFTTFFLLAQVLVVAAAATPGCVDESAQAEFFTSIESSEREVINIAVVLSASLSLLGSSFIVGTWLAFPDLRTPAFKIIVWMSAADMLHALGYIVDGSRQDLLCPDAVCFVTAAWNQFFSLATYLWTAAVAYNINCVLVQVAHQDSDALVRKLHSSVWGGAAAFTIAAAAAGTLGLAGQWCWIRADEQWARGFLYFFPLSCIFAFNCRTYRRISEAVRASPARAAVVGRLRYYLLVFCCCTAASVVNRAQNFFAPSSPSFPLYLLQSVTQPLLGLGNALVYGYNRKVREAYRAWWPTTRAARWWPCARCCCAGGGAWAAGCGGGPGGVSRLLEEPDTGQESPALSALSSSGAAAAAAPAAADGAAAAAASSASAALS